MGSDDLEAVVDRGLRRAGVTAEQLAPVRGWNAGVFSAAGLPNPHTPEENDWSAIPDTCTCQWRSDQSLSWVLAERDPTCPHHGLQ
jgi:hypothetical protein